MCGREGRVASWEGEWLSVRSLWAFARESSQSWQSVMATEMGQNGKGADEVDRGRLGFERWEWDGTSIRWKMMPWGRKNNFDMKRRRGRCWQKWRVDTWRRAGWWYLQPSDGPDVSPILARYKCNCKMMMARVSPPHWGRTNPAYVTSLLHLEFHWSKKSW